MAGAGSGVPQPGSAALGGARRRAAVRPGDAARPTNGAPKNGPPAVRGTASASVAMAEAEAPLESPRACARVHGPTGGSFSLGPHAGADSAARQDGARQDGARHGMTLRAKGVSGSRLEEGPRTARASSAAAEGGRRDTACAAVTPRAKTARAAAASDGRWR